MKLSKDYPYWSRVIDNDDVDVHADIHDIEQPSISRKLVDRSHVIPSRVDEQEEKKKKKERYMKIQKKRASRAPRWSV